MECRYDGSFAGLLTLVLHLRELGMRPTAIYSGEPSQAELFAAPLEVASDPGRARRYLAQLGTAHGPWLPRLLRDAWLGQQPQAPLLLQRYLERAEQLGPVLATSHADPAVHAVERLAHRVRREAHRLKGLVRFRELADGLLYAPLRPDALVLPLLGHHFRQRLGVQPWLLHDRRRDLGLLCSGGELRLGELAAAGSPIEATDEAGWQQLWRRFFAAIAIKERRNPRLQQQFMPKKYWAELIEMEDFVPAAKGVATAGKT